MPKLVAKTLAGGKCRVDERATTTPGTSHTDWASAATDMAQIRLPKVALAKMHPMITMRSVIDPLA